MDALFIPTAVNIFKRNCTAAPAEHPNSHSFRLEMRDLINIKISDGEKDQSHFAYPSEALRIIKEHLGLNHYVDILAEDINWTGQNKMALWSRDCYILIRTDKKAKRAIPV